MCLCGGLVDVTICVGGIAVGGALVNVGDSRVGGTAVGGIAVGGLGVRVGSHARTLADVDASRISTNRIMIIFFILFSPFLCIRQASQGFYI